MSLRFRISGCRFGWPFGQRMKARKPRVFSRFRRVRNGHDLSRGRCGKDLRNKPGAITVGRIDMRAFRHTADLTLRNRAHRVAAISWSKSAAVIRASLTMSVQGLHSEVFWRRLDSRISASRCRSWPQYLRKNSQKVLFGLRPCRRHIELRLLGAIDWSLQLIADNICGIRYYHQHGPDRSGLRR